MACGHHLLQAAMAEEKEAGPDVMPDDATDVDDAASMVSGLSAYAASTAATSTAASTGRPASTVGGRRPQRNKQKVLIGRCLCCCVQQWPAGSCMLPVIFVCCTAPSHHLKSWDSLGRGTLTHTTNPPRRLPCTHGCCCLEQHNPIGCDSTGGRLRSRCCT